MTTQISEQEYLSRPSMSVQFYIDNNSIDINSSNTCFAHTKRYKKYVKKALMDQYQSILHMAKYKGIKITYTIHIKKQIDTLWEAYTMESKEADALFDQMVTQYSLLKRRGIHMGCSDDRQLRKCNELKYQYEAYFYRNRPIAHMEDCVYMLRELAQNINAARIDDTITLQL